MKDKILLALGGLLIAVAVLKPTLDHFPIVPNTVSVKELDIPSVDNETKILLQPIVESLKNGSSDRKLDGKKLASLYLDLATLISLDGENMVIKTTEDIKQANSIAGPMLKLNMKGKYPNLSESWTAYVKSQLGDDAVQLDEILY
jgi:hypothetical protein